MEKLPFPNGILILVQKYLQTILIRQKCYATSTAGNQTGNLYRGNFIGC